MQSRGHAPQTIEVAAAADALFEVPLDVRTLFRLHLVVEIGGERLGAQMPFGQVHSLFSKRRRSCSRPLAIRDRTVPMGISSTWAISR